MKRYGISTAIFPGYCQPWGIRTESQSLTADCLYQRDERIDLAVTFEIPGLRTS